MALGCCFESYIPTGKSRHVFLLSSDESGKRVAYEKSFQIENLHCYLPLSLSAFVAQDGEIMTWSFGAC